MSERFESYHLLTTKAQDATELLKRSGLSAFILPPVGAWVSMVPRAKHEDFPKKLAQANQHFLLHLTYEEDHGWSFTFYDQFKKICHYQCTWDNDFSFDITHYSPLIYKFLPHTLTENLDEKIEAVLYLDTFEDLIRLEPVKTFTKLLGLRDVETISPGLLSKEYDTKKSKILKIG